MIPSLRRAARGQAAAMMALTISLIALMVALTLGIGMKIKEKAEAQTLADVSAYSQAVATARTFNAIAILNRAEISVMVSAVSTQTLVSYSSYYRLVVKTAKAQLEDHINKPGNCVDVAPCMWCTRFNALLAAATKEDDRIDKDWDKMDKDGNDRIDAARGEAGTLHGAAQSLFTSLIEDQIIGKVVTPPLPSPPLANAIVKQVDNTSTWQGEMTALGAVIPINLRELGKAPNCAAGEDLVCDSGGPSELSLQMTLGSRGWPVEREAKNLTRMLEDGLMAAIGMVAANGDAVNFRKFDGNTRYIDQPLDHGALMGGLALMGENMEGDMSMDIVSMDPINCPGKRKTKKSDIATWLYSTSFLNQNDSHYFQYEDADGGTQIIQEPQGNHALQAGCTPPVVPCGMWVGFFDMNPNHVDPGQEFKYLYGQPKLVSSVQRDYLVRGQKADPWNLLKHIRIRASQNEDFDNNGIQTAAGLDISKQTAIATALAYYHRKDHWKEPPNFFNPFWHATLVTSRINEYGVTAKGGTDLTDAVGPNNQFAKDVITKLENAGFKGWH